MTKETYLPPFLGSFTFSNLRHVALVIITNISHVRNQQIDRFEIMDRIVYSFSSLSSFRADIPSLRVGDLPTTCALRSASSTSGQTAA